MAFRKLDEQSLPTHRARILALEESTPARWGGMNAAAMVCHLRAILELSLGETKVPLVVSPIIGKPIGLLFFYVFTRFPKGRKGSAPPIPALCPLPPLSFQEERQRLLAALERFVARQESDPREKVPAPISWGGDSRPMGARSRSSLSASLSAVRSGVSADRRVSKRGPAPASPDNQEPEGSNHRVERPRR